MNQNAVMTICDAPKLDKNTIQQIQQSQKYGEKLIVVVNSNISRSPQNINILRNLGIADRIIFSSSQDYFKRFSKYLPHVVTISSDRPELIYKLSDFLYENKLRTNVITIDSYQNKSKNAFQKTKQITNK